ncbi:MAG: hypothetical protein ABR964_14540 [Tepidisphaeraceae bacterium]|jgi:hypothetical protein
MPMRALVILLAMSPIAFLVCLAGFGFAFDTVMGSLVGDVAVFVPLAFLALSKDVGVAPACRRWLRGALGSVILLLPAVALHFAPTYSIKFGHGDQIRLDPPLHPMSAEGAAMLRGLSVKDGVMILKSEPNKESDNPSPFTACDYSGWYSPPSHFNDENGNGLDFRMSGDDRLHFQDDRGGYADIKWDGKQFILLASHSAGQADSAKSPSSAAKLAGKFGNFFLILCPMLAWLLITKSVQEYFHESGIAAVSLVLAGVLQIAGMMVLAFTVFSAPDTLDEVTGALAFLFTLIACGLSIAGLSIPGWHMLRGSFPAVLNT